VINRVLIANNGIAAVKEMLSVRRWAFETFGDERAIHFIAMVTPEDLKANAEYIRMADSFEEVPGGKNVNNYANVPLIVDIAERTGAHAVWAGWGHASENPKLPEALAKTKNKIAFIGPPSKAMRDLGGKIASTIIAQSAGVPVVPWSGQGITVSYKETGIPDEIVDKASVFTVEQAREVLATVGYPVMIKASDGGGGKGIRKVASAEELEMAFRQVQGEVPNSPIFIMKLVSNAHHLEVQVLADQYGEAISLYGRDCSVQRRHQKIIEEGPPLVAKPDLWLQMEKAAVAMAKEVGYVGAGTVEYLYVDGAFYFLELNPRLQVEHPVTEEITKVNIPAAQLNLAMGIPLHRIANIRSFYGEQPFESTPIDFASRRPVPPHGHVIACRITAENPDQGFKPTSGDLHALNFHSSPKVWAYFSVDNYGSVHEFADSQFGHVFAWGPSRNEARQAMILALKELSIRGEIRTPVEFLLHILETEDFRNNDIHTGWLDVLIAKEINYANIPTSKIVLCGLAYKAYYRFAHITEKYLGFLTKGQIPATALLRTRIHMSINFKNVRYNFLIRRCSPTSFLVNLEGKTAEVEIECQPLKGNGLLVVFDGESHTCYGSEEVGGLRLSVGSSTVIFTKEQDPSQLRTATPSKLVRYLVEDGTHLNAGAPFAEVEVMKMYMPLTTQNSGIIHFVKSEGSVLHAGDVVATMTLDDISAVKKAIPFEGDLPALGPPRSPETKPHQLLRSTLKRIRLIIDGYESKTTANLIEQLWKLLRDPRLPIYDFKETLTILQSSVTDQAISAFIRVVHSILVAYKKGVKGSETHPFPGSYLLDVVQQFYDNNSSKSALLTPLLELTKKYEHGLKGHGVNVISALLKDYLATETPFHEKTLDAAILDLRDQHKDDLATTMTTVLSHSKAEVKAKLMVVLLDKLQQTEWANIHHYIPILEDISLLSGKGNIEISLMARQIVMAYQLPTFKQREASVGKFLAGIVQSKDPKFRTVQMASIVESSSALFDVLLPFLSDKNVEMRKLALEVYIRRTYHSYKMHDLAVDILKLPRVENATPEELAIPCAYWHFAIPDIHNTLSLSSETPSDERVLSRMNSGESVDDLMLLEMASLSESQEKIRYGMMVAVKDLAHFQKIFDLLVERYHPPPRFADEEEFLNVLNVAMETQSADSNVVESFSSFLKTKSAALVNGAVRRVTLVIPKHEDNPDVYTFRERLDYGEDPIYRHVEPPLAYHLELKRLSNYTIQLVPTASRMVHCYYAEERGKEGKPDCDRCFFIRAIVREGLLFASDATPSPDPKLVMNALGERVFSEALNTLELAIGDTRFKPSQNHHIFLKFMPEVMYEPDKVTTMVDELGEKFAHRMWQLKVREVEIVRMLKQFHASIPLRFFASNPSGYRFQADGYIEVKENDASGGSRVLLASLDSKKEGPLAGHDIGQPYPILSAIQRKRFEARNMNTTYVYDFPDLFSTATQQLWLAYPSPPTTDDDQDAHDWSPSPRKGSIERRNKEKISKEEKEKEPETESPKKNHRKKLSLTETLRKSVSGTLQRMLPRRRTLTDTKKIPPWVPQELVQTWELTLDPHTGGVKEVQRPIGQNTIGMVGWRIRLFTPESPQGRDVIVIANDITFQMGSFGPEEDLFFYNVSQYAREHGWPRIYLAANSGARIGLATEVKEAYKIRWIDPVDPSKGFQYLYLSPAEYQILKPYVNAVKVSGPGGEEEYQLTDIIGKDNDLGIENLRGSGMIAGETSRAYEEIFTITLVTGRTVGIGAYLVRLGQRTVQNEGPVLLTGAPALNKVLGREVYTSNVQLGGPQIMYANGVSHLAVHDELQGISNILRWVSFIPAKANGPLPVIRSFDPIDREIDFVPKENVPYDPRHLIAGCDLEGLWLSGFFDKGSWMETLSGWAKTVVCGRARLGGIPVGVIAAETRTIEKITPADPANLDSEEHVVQQAGGVWFPDSAYKTAQAIKDFNKGEQLPLIIFANWRGFSGGMRDMFDEILKFGSYIVDNLREYKQPVLVYMPPFGELRGGAWAVLDPTINPDMMEMYASENCKAGVLEPAGAVEIKYRERDLLETIRRVDGSVQALQAELAKAIAAKDTPQVAALRKQISAREEVLLPSYRQAAVLFAALHDTPGRMKAKGAIHDIIPWKRARAFFYWRLKRRLAEEEVRKKILELTGGTASYSQQTTLLMAWLKDFSKKNPPSASTGSTEDGGWQNDQHVLKWLSTERVDIRKRLATLRQNAIVEQAKALAHEDMTVWSSIIIDTLNSLPAEQRQNITQQILKGVQK